MGPTWGKLWDPCDQTVWDPLHFVAGGQMGPMSWDPNGFLGGTHPKKTAWDPFEQTKWGPLYYVAREMASIHGAQMGFKWDLWKTFGTHTSKPSGTHLILLWGGQMGSVLWDQGGADGFQDMRPTHNIGPVAHGGKHIKIPTRQAINTGTCWHLWITKI